MERTGTAPSEESGADGTHNMETLSIRFNQAPGPTVDSGSLCQHRLRMPSLQALNTSLRYRKLVLKKQKAVYWWKTVPAKSDESLSKITRNNLLFRLGFNSNVVSEEVEDRNKEEAILMLFFASVDVGVAQGVGSCR